MQRRLLILGLGLALALAALWGIGALDGLARMAVAAQREVQNLLAGGLRRIRAGEAGAYAALMLLCLSYGFLHAVGPGHGKVLIGGYGLARRVPLFRLLAIAVASSLAQATVAVVLVHAGILAFGWTRDRVLGVAEGVMTPLGHALIGLVGLWLVWRGLRGMRGMRDGGADHDPATHGHGAHRHDHATHHHGEADHPHDAACGCGHAHGPSLAAVEQATTWRETALLIGGIALRPCSGALFLLILTWQMQIPAAGIAGVYAMGLGTAAVTLAVAGMAVWAREGALAALPGTGLARAIPLAELGLGLIVAGVAATLILQG